MSEMQTTLERMFTQLLKGGRDSRHGVVEELVLPDANDAPAFAAQGFADNAVALHVSAQLRGPVPLVRRRLSAVLRADVPEAAINEDRDLTRCEHDVRLDADTTVEPEKKVLPVPVAELVQRFPKLDLGLRICPAVGAHVPGPAGVQRSRIDARSVRSLTGFPEVLFRHDHTNCRAVKVSSRVQGKITPARSKPDAPCLAARRRTDVGLRRR